MVLPEKNLQSPGFSIAFSLAISFLRTKAIHMSAAKARRRAMFVLSGTDTYSRNARALAPGTSGSVAAMRFVSVRVWTSRALCAIRHLSHSRAEVCHAYKEFSESRNKKKPARKMRTNDSVGEHEHTSICAPDSRASRHARPPSGHAPNQAWVPGLAMLTSRA